MWPGGEKCGTVGRSVVDPLPGRGEAGAAGMMALASSNPAET